LEEVFVGSNIIEKTFGDQNTAVVLALVGSFGNDITNSVDNIDESLSTIGTLFRDNN
jgi:hypothetical protein